MLIELLHQLFGNGLILFIELIQSIHLPFLYFVRALYVRLRRVAPMRRSATLIYVVYSGRILLERR